MNQCQARVLLINPSFDRQKQYGGLSDIVKPAMPLSLGALGAYLEANGCIVRILDEQLDDLSFESLKSIIAEFKPNIAGVSCLTPVAKRAYSLAADIKRVDSKIMTIFGNVHPTICADECLNTGNIDIVVRGEGEQTTLDCVKLYNGLMQKKDISGISYRENGKVINNQDRPYIRNLDELPRFGYHLLLGDNLRYSPGHIISSRGCPYNCVFCSSRSISGRGYRSNTPERVISDIEYLKNAYKIKSLMFEDDNFLVDKKRAHRICDLIIEKGFNKDIKWRCQARADLVDEGVLRKMKEAGCISVSFGIETASQRLLDLIDKDETVEDNVNAVNLCKKVGINSRGAFILGLPTETKKESYQTIRFAKSLSLSEAKFSLATPYPGTKLYDIAKQEGINPEEDWPRLSTTVGLGSYEPIYAPKGRTTAELKRLQKKAHLSFYLRPRIIMSMFDNTSPDNITSLPRITSFKDFIKYAKLAFNLLFKKA